MGVFVFNCPHCGKQIGAQDEWEGKTSMCPHCQKPVVIRHPDPNPPPPEAIPIGGIPPQPGMSAWGEYDAGPPEICKNAKNAMWFGIASVCCCHICSIVAVILGILGLNEINKSNGRLEGKSYAWIGIGLGILPWIMTILQLIFAPQLTDNYIKLIEHFMGSQYRTEHVEMIDEAPVQPLPEPKEVPQNNDEPEKMPPPKPRPKPSELI